MQNNDTDYIIYENLGIEIVKKHISVNEMAKGLGVTLGTLKSKLSGKESFDLSEAFYMNEVFFPENDIYYLFKELTVE